jgi:long-chain acyl-CoA synthetase
MAALQGSRNISTMEAARKPKPHTLNDIFFSVVERDAPVVMLTEINGAWSPVSSSTLYQSVIGTARGLCRWGIGHGDRVAILSENRPEWAIADFATLFMGAAVVPIYATLTSEQALYVLRHSGARTIFVSSKAQLEKVQAIASETDLERIIIMDDVDFPGVEKMSNLTASGPRERNAEFEKHARAISRDDLATLIYTSGTTGTPKGVMLTHGNLAANLDVSLDQFQFEPGQHVGVSFLPLSHITARHLDYAMFHHGVTLAYCPFIDNLPRVLTAIRPTVFVAVPRVYEKIYNQVQRTVGATGTKRKLYNWAIGVGERNLPTVLEGKKPTSLSWRLADRLLYSKVRTAMGGRTQVYISGGAPLGRELGEWYAKIGIRIHEGYGLTETSPVIALNDPSAHRLGSVGKPLPNLELKIAEDGEILVKGPSVFRGYWNMPEETINAFDGEWFKTGDVGHLDADNFLFITDRKKDLIKTSGGKFIAPQPIEGSLKANPLISEAAVIGDRRRFPAVVIAPAFAVLNDWAQENGINCRDAAELVAHPKVKTLYENIVAEINKNLAQYEKLKKVLVLPEEMSVENGTLTPTLKLRRRIVEQRYKDQIERLYAEATTEFAAH